MNQQHPGETLVLPRKRADSDNPRDRVDLRLDRSIVARIDMMRPYFAETLSGYIRRAVMDRLCRDEDEYLFRNGNRRRGDES